MSTHETIEVPDALYYKVLAARRDVEIIHLEAKLLHDRLNRAQAECTAAEQALVDYATENGKYVLVDGIKISDTVRSVARVPNQ